jgi:putative phage-type endonuclease
MPITEKQRALRRGHLGSSDIAAIFGKDPFKTAYDVWLDKTGKLPPQDENEAMFAGSMFENGVLSFAEKKLGRLKRNQYRAARDLPIASNIDALAVDSGNPVEAKTAGLFGPLKENWGEENTDEVPDRVILQAHAHLICTGAQLCHIAAFIGGRGFVLYAVSRDNELVEIISERAAKFWQINVKGNIPPENSTPSLAIIKHATRIPDTVCGVSDDIVNRWLDAKASVSMAEEEKENAEAVLLAALGTAEAGTCSLGTVTYFEQSSNRLDTTRLKTEMPDLAAQFTKKSTSRVLRFKKSS